MSIGVSRSDFTDTELLQPFAISYLPKVEDKSIEKLFTPVPVVADKDSFIYGIWDKGMGLQNPGNDLRGDTGKSKKFEDKYSQETGQISVYSGNTEVSVKIGNRYPGGYDRYEQIRTQRLLQHAARGRAIRGATTLAYSGMRYKDTPSVKWDAASGTTIFKNFKTGKTSVFNQCGEEPNRIAFSRSVADALAVSPEFIARYAGIDPKVTSCSIPDQIDDMEAVVLKSRYNTAKKGQTASISEVFGDVCYIGFVSDIPDPFGLTGAATFRPEDKPAVKINKWYDPETQCWIIEYELWETNIVVAQECWYVWYNCLT